MSKETSASSILFQLVGPEIAEQITAQLGGGVVYIPCRVREGRDDMIKAQFHGLLMEGGTCMSSYRQLAREYALSPRRIMEIVKQ